jgi:NADH dehydrogenase
MKVLVTGATGFVGREIVSRLQEARHNIVIIARDASVASARAAERGFGGQVRSGNILDVSSLEEACKGIDAVIHLVGIIGEVGEQTFENVHARGTQNIVAAAKKAGIKRLVHMSALGTRPNAISRYHQTKWAAEEAVRQSGLDNTIFRPSLIYGRGDQFVNVFARIIRLSPILPVLGNDVARFQPISIEAVVTAFVKALSEPRSVAQTYDLCGPEALTLPEMLDQILEVMHRKRFKLPIPHLLSRCQAAFLEFLYPRLLRKASPLNRDQLIMLEEGNTGNGQPADQLFGLRHAGFREGIARYLSNPR